MGQGGASPWWGALGLVPLLWGSLGTLSPPHGIPARANPPGHLGSLEWFETPNFEWVSLSCHQSRPHSRCREAQGTSLPNCASVSPSADGLWAMLRLPKAGLVPWPLQGFHRGGSEQLNSPWGEMPTLVPGGGCPRDPQGAWCPCMPPALLSPPDTEKSPDYWNKGARSRLESALALQPAARRAKNIILFMGDGESPRSQPGPMARRLHSSQGTWLVRRWGQCRSPPLRPAPGNAWGGQDCPRSRPLATLRLCRARRHGAAHSVSSSDLQGAAGRWVR